MWASRCTFLSYIHTNKYSRTHACTRVYSYSPSNYRHLDDIWKNPRMSLFIQTCVSDSFCWNLLEMTQNGQKSRQTYSRWGGKSEMSIMQVWKPIKHFENACLPSWTVQDCASGELINHCHCKSWICDCHNPSVSVSVTNQILSYNSSV